jgi:V/A-type H+/Na+-transporting ATPase subunit E
VIAVTTIEDKIKLFSKIIYEKTQEEKQKEFDKFEIEKGIKLEQKNKLIENKHKEILAEIQKKAQIKASEIVSKEKISTQKQLLNLKETLIEETITELKSLLSDFVCSQEYSELFREQVKYVLLSLDKGKYIFYLTEKDKSIHEGEILELAKNIEGLSVKVDIMNGDILGGVVVEDEGRRFRLDNSFSTKLNDFKQYVGLRVMESIK